MTVSAALAFGIYPVSRTVLAMTKNSTALITIILKNDEVPKTVEFFATGKGLKLNGRQDQVRTNLSFGAYEQMNMTLAVVSARDMTVNVVYGVVEGQGMFQTTTSDTLKVIVGSGVGSPPNGSGGGGGSDSGGGGGGGGGGNYPVVNYTSCNGTYKLVGNIWICIPKVKVNVSSNGTVASVQLNVTQENKTVVSAVPSAETGGGQAIVQDVSSQGGGIAQTAVGGAAVKEAVKTAVEKMVRVVKAGSALGMMAVVFGVITLVLQGASYVVVRRSDAL
jgi:hypothetical protein